MAVQLQFEGIRCFSEPQDAQTHFGCAPSIKLRPIAPDVPSRFRLRSAWMIVLNAAPSKPNMYPQGGSLLPAAGTSRLGNWRFWRQAMRAKALLIVERPTQKTLDSQRWPGDKSLTLWTI